MIARLVAIGMCAVVGWRCSAEELVYKPSGTPGDASAETAGTAGVDSSGIGGNTGWLEICGNGIDDDLNGSTDCEDPNCENYACVTVAPSGWTGPVALYQGPVGTLAACPKGLTSVFEGTTDLDSEVATCGSCSCGSPTSQVCGADVGYYSDTACATLLGNDPPFTTGSCDSTTATAVGSVKITGFDPSGTCGSGSVPTPSTQTPVWKTEARACALEDGTGNPAGCASGEVCAPLSSESLACILQTGELDCPEGYPDKHLFYSSFDDTRNCSACSCAFSGTSCTATVTFFGEKTCATALGAHSALGCYAHAALAAKLSAPNVPDAKCTPSGSSPTGCVLPAQPTTVCCQGTAPEACPSGGGPVMVRVPTTSGASYCIDSTEVTRAEYEDFLLTSPSPTSQPAHCSWNTSFTPIANWPPTATTADLPVSYVDWCDAFAFCAWAGKRLCGAVEGGSATTSAPTDAAVNQWFSACSAGGTRTQPYGNGTSSDACPFNTTISAVKADACCVGGYPGLYDLVGNVEEWVDACSAQSGAKDQCSIRGQAACADQELGERDDRAARIGFRCCS